MSLIKGWSVRQEDGRDVAPAASGHLERAGRVDHAVELWLRCPNVWNIAAWRRCLGLVEETRMENGDKIALAALALSLISAAIAGTAFFTRGAYDVSSLRKDVGDPSAQSGLYGLVGQAREKAERASALAVLAREDADKAEEKSATAELVATRAESKAAQADDASKVLSGRVDEAVDNAGDAKRLANNAVTASGNALARSVPVGTILAWVPTPTQPEPPKEWVICDGKNGTPNLNSRFLRGVQYIDQSQVEGGQEDIPRDGGHSHGGRTGETASSGEPKKNGDDGHHTHTHSHTIAVDGEHDHGGVNLPPFYTVVFIMKTT